MTSENDQRREGGDAVERDAAEQHYTITAFDYVRDPVGSRNWTLFWNGWQARAALTTPQARPDGGEAGEFKAGFKSAFTYPAAPAPDVTRLVKEAQDFHDHAVDQGWHDCAGIPGGCPMLAALTAAQQEAGQ